MVIKSLRAVLRLIQQLAAVAANVGRSPNPISNGHDLTKAALIADHVQNYDRVLDIGGGTGRRLTDIRLFREIDGTCIDVYEAAHEAHLPITSAPRRIPFDGEVIPFGQKTFEVAMICYVLHHLSDDHAQRLLRQATDVATRTLIILEDSLPNFDLLYRLRNWAHATEANLEYEARSDTFRRNFRHNFKTHQQWIDTISALPNVESVECIPLDNISKYKHHTMFIAHLRVPNPSR